MADGTAKVQSPQVLSCNNNILTFHTVKSSTFYCHYSTIEDCTVKCSCSPLHAARRKCTKTYSSEKENYIYKEYTQFLNAGLLLVMEKVPVKQRL